MPASVTGSQDLVISGASHSAAYTVPAGTTAAYLFWHYWSGSDGLGLSTATINSVSPDATYELGTTSGGDSGQGVAVWYNPSTGSQTHAITLDIAPNEGASAVMVYVQDGDLTAWRDADAASAQGGTAVGVTLTTVADDLVIMFDGQYSATPATPSGWTSILAATTNNSRGGRASYIVATGSTQACDAQATVNYSGVVAISIPEAAGGGGPSIPILTHHIRQQS